MPQTTDRKAETARFLRFCAVGTAGFLADTGMLLVIVHVFGVNPVAAKILSFGLAVFLTFELNRRWAFGVTRSGNIGTALAAYFGVQSTGFLCNFGVFTALIYVLPVPFNNLVLCSMVAAAAALVVNYAGAKRLVFGIRPLLHGKQ